LLFVCFAIIKIIHLPALHCDVRSKITVTLFLYFDKNQDYVYHRLFCRFDENVLHLLQINNKVSRPPPNHCWITPFHHTFRNSASWYEPLVPFFWCRTKLSPRQKISFLH
jgi:hypothetical protein